MIFKNHFRQTGWFSLDILSFIMLHFSFGLIGIKNHPQLHSEYWIEPNWGTVECKV